MPAYFMRQQGVDQAVIDKAIYTGGHDATALAVANKKVDAGALDELVFARMIKEGKLSDSQVRVFYTTPPFFDYVWAARKRLDPAMAEAFANAMLKLDQGNAEQKPILPRIWSRLPRKHFKVARIATGIAQSGETHRIRRGFDMFRFLRATFASFLIGD